MFVRCVPSARRSPIVQPMPYPTINTLLDDMFPKGALN
jgi:hypothetical protein